jgi:hypothetical protein
MPKPYSVDLRERAVAALEAQLKANPDGRLIDHCQRWQATTGQAVSLTALHRACRALDWTHKKSSRPANATKPSGPPGAKRTRPWRRPT